MRRLFGLMAVAALVAAFLALASCHGSGGRSIFPLPGGFLGGSLLPYVEGADAGDVPLTFSTADQRAYWHGEQSLGAFDDVSAGGFVFVNDTTAFDIWNDGAGAYYDNFSVFDTNGDTFADFINVSMRALSTAAGEAEVGVGYAKIGGAAYLPTDLWVQNLNLYLPINQAYADRAVTVYKWQPMHGVAQAGQTGGVWTPLAGVQYSVRLHPYSGFANYYVVEVLNYTGFLGEFGAFVPYHTAGAGGT